MEGESVIDPYFSNDKTEVWKRCDLPRVTEKGWARLTPKFTFSECPPFVLMSVIIISGGKRPYFLAPGVGVHSTGPTLPSCPFTNDTCHRPRNPEFFSSGVCPHLPCL